MKEPRIASFLPAATEMVYLLGLGDRLVGRTHECDWPPQALEKPVLVECALDLSRLSMREIDAAVTERIKKGKSLYVVDEAKLRAAAPTLLVTQNLCQVCGPAGNEVSQVLKTLKPAPEIVWQTPAGFEDVLGAFEELGDKTGKGPEARRWTAAARERVKAIAAKTGARAKKRVAFVEWVDPVYCGGHWVAEMLGWAGGDDPNARAGVDSARIPWADVVAAKPELVIVSPCGFGLEKAIAQARLLPKLPGVPVCAVDANAYFARPGPRLVDGVELLAHLIHPDLVAWSGPASAFARL
jgi:iron complex transport system substrate-binding protein